MCRLSSGLRPGGKGSVQASLEDLVSCIVRLGATQETLVTLRRHMPTQVHSQRCHNELTGLLACSICCNMHAGIHRPRLYPAQLANL